MRKDKHLRDFTWGKAGILLGGNISAVQSVLLEEIFPVGQDAILRGDGRYGGCEIDKGDDVEQVSLRQTRRKTDAAPLNLVQLHLIKYSQISSQYIVIDIRLPYFSVRITVLQRPDSVLLVAGVVVKNPKTPILMSNIGSEIRGTDA